jgi:hypothetical protein
VFAQAKLFKIISTQSGVFFVSVFIVSLYSFLSIVSFMFKISVPHQETEELEIFFKIFNKPVGNPSFNTIRFGLNFLQKDSLSSFFHKEKFLVISIICIVGIQKIFSTLIHFSIRF